MRTLLLAALLTGAAAAQDVETLRAEAAALRADDVAWRKIPWKTCLLEGLAASRAAKKPLILWIFIDRPVDDERC